jgi:hypothetical protein
MRDQYFENAGFSSEDKANTAFQIVTAMRDVLNVALKSTLVPTYEKSLAYIKDISPQTYEAIVKHLPGKNDNELIRLFKEKAKFLLDSSDMNAFNAKAIELINEDIDKINEIIHNNVNARTSKSHKQKLMAALKHFESRVVTEHQLLNHDFYMANSSDFHLIDEEVDRKDYQLLNGNKLRVYLAHPNKVEHTLGVDMIYECYDLEKKLVRFVHLQYKTWKGQTLTFDLREMRQLERLKLHNCTSKCCEVPQIYASTDPYRLPYCSAFLRPTNKILPRSSKMKTMGDHIPLCKLNQLISTNDTISKAALQALSLSQTSFEEAFNKYLAGSRWMPIHDLEKYYEKRNLLELAGNVRLVAQEVSLSKNIF